jgi:hypothetical protein
MTENTEDAELGAIKVLLSALSDLDEAARQRVLAYVFTRLDLQAPVADLEIGSVETDTTELPGSSVRRPRGVVPTIIEFKEAKKPRSANEMAAVLAYFLQYEAPQDERKDTVNKADLDRYFHLAKFRKPGDTRLTLVNSKNAGYLDQRGKGEYALSPIGYNLVAYKLGGDAQPSAIRRKVRRKSAAGHKSKR